MKAIILIPARYASSRFPGKPLAEIAGMSMIQRVFKNCKDSGYPTYVVTDDQKIEDHVHDFNGEVIRIDDDVVSGTERIALAYQRGDFSDVEFVVNVQGDEPLLKGSKIKELVEFHSSREDNITTLVRKRYSTEEYNDPNKVKALYCEDTSRCLYFSRGDILFAKEPDEPWFLHIGVYSYRCQDLLKFCQLKPHKHEFRERLEQLRALAHGMQIGAIESDIELQGVDIPDDVKRVEEILSGKS